MLYLSIFSFLACFDESKSVEPTGPAAESWLPGEVEDYLAPPVALIDGPQNGRVGQEIQLSGTRSHDPLGRNLASFSWRCSNDVESESSSLVFTPRNNGVVRCELTVTAVNGKKDTQSVQIEVKDADAPQWTVMVFINGDNDLEYAGIDDINEMEIAGSSEDVNIIVQFDRSRDYATEEGNWHGTRRYKIVKDDSAAIASPVLEELGEIDSGNYESVVDFVEWGVENYPAEKYAVVLWNHGASWFARASSATHKGISMDEGSGNEISVSKGDLANMLADITDVTGAKLEVVGMDACIMQSWEIAHVVAPYARYYVASQDYEGFDGWNYEGAMLDLVRDPFMSGEGFGAAVGQRFIETGDIL